MRQRELYKKVQLLKAGQIVMINGDFFRAIKLQSDDKRDVCMQCDLDSICHGDVLDVCYGMETNHPYKWRLKLAHPA